MTDADRTADATGTLRFEPVVSWPRTAQAGRTYLVSVDLRIVDPPERWPYDQEEFTFFCVLDGAPAFTVEEGGETGVVVHRFGGTYGPAQFMVTATAAAREGELRLALLSGGGVTVQTFALPSVISEQEQMRREKVPLQAAGPFAAPPPEAAEAASPAQATTEQTIAEQATAQQASVVSRPPAFAAERPSQPVYPAQADSALPTVMPQGSAAPAESPLSAYEDPEPLRPERRRRRGLADMFRLRLRRRRYRYGAEVLHQHRRLDYAWFLRRAGEARDQIRILDTFSGLFRADRDLAIRALRDASMRGADIRVLLMSPSTEASALREFQIRQTKPGLWINDNIQSNIADFRLLDAAILAAGNDRPRGRFELRVYTIAPPFALYGWDERLLFAFLPPHDFSDQSTHLEIATWSALGREVLDQFEAIWQDAAPIPQLLPIEVVDEQSTRSLLVRFVHLDSATYLVSKRIDAAMRANPALLVRFGAGDTTFQPEIIAFDDPIQQALANEFYNKYARRPDASFHLLRPWTMDIPTDQPKEYDSLPTRTLMDLIAQSQGTIRILDTSSTLMAEGGNVFARAVEQAMARGVKVQVLLLAPTTKAAQDRAAEIQDPAFDTHVEANIRELRRIARLTSNAGVPADHLQVRLYDQLPDCTVHQIDDRTILAFLPYQRRTSRAKHLEVREDSSLGQFGQLQFDSKWRTARPLEGMRYADVTGASGDTRKLLVRMWGDGEARYLASNRIEAVLNALRIEQRGNAHEPEIRLVVEDRPGEEFTLSAPIAPETAEGESAITVFNGIFGRLPDAYVRRLVPTRSGRPQSRA